MAGIFTTQMAPACEKYIVMLKDISVREEKSPQGENFFFGGDKFGLQTGPFRF